MLKAQVTPGAIILLIAHLEAGNLSTTGLVLLPGLDGTGKLFTDFVEALPASISPSVIAYPADKFLRYAELLPFLCATLPDSNPFVLLAESFSTPLAVQYAATQPANLKALIICAGFVRNPTGRLKPLFDATARPWLFRRQMPNFILEHFLLGSNAPVALAIKLRDVLRVVDPRVISARVRDVLSCDVRIDLAGVTAPMMYLCPLNDRLIHARNASDIRRARPDIFFEPIPGPHMILQREPRRCAALVSRFIHQLHT